MGSAKKKVATKKVATKTKAAQAGTGKPSARKASAAKAARPRTENAKVVDPAGAAKAIDAKFASLGDWRGALLTKMRKLIHEADPEVVEEWKWMGTAVWSHDGMYANANPFKDKVKITFMHGAQLADPSKLFNAGLDGNKWRAIDLYVDDSLDDSAFKALVREAVAYNTTHAVPKSKGSRASLLAKSGAAPKAAKRELKPRRR